MLTSADVTALREQVRGSVFTPDEDGYAEQLSGFQAAYRHEPAVVVTPEDAADVARAVTFAAGHGLAVAVQSTGHGLTVVDEGGLVILTTRLNDVTVDASARTARIGAGARWKDVIAATVPHGLAPLSGSAPQTGVAGYLLGGGIGLLGREFGYAADLVRALEAVTANGCAQRITADGDPDLFWALLGGRDNFGIVTAIETELLPVSRLYGGGIYFDAADAAKLLTHFRDWTATVPESITSSIGMIEYPPVPSFPEPLRGRHVVHVRFATTDLEGGPGLVEPWKTVATPVFTHLGELGYDEVGSIYREPDFPHAYSGSNALLSELTDKAIDAVVELAGTTAPVSCIVDVRHLGGALSRPPRMPNSVPFREAGYILRILSGLDGPGLDGTDETEARAAHQRVFDSVEPWTLGRSLNFVYGRREAEELVGEIYDEPTLGRLRALKATYDPANTFRGNHNIRPS